MNNITNEKQLVMYVIAKEKYLQTLLNDGAISQSDFDKMSKFLYDRFHIANTMTNDLALIQDLLSFRAGEVPTVRESSSSNDRTAGSDSIAIAQAPAFVSLTEAVRHSTDASPAHVIQSWMRSNQTVEFLGLWEKEHNPEFNTAGYEGILLRKQGASFSISSKQWVEQTNAIGLMSKQGKSGGTYAHPLIACEFMLWLSPEYRLTFLEMCSGI